MYVFSYIEIMDWVVLNFLGASPYSSYLKVSTTQQQNFEHFLKNSVYLFGTPVSEAMDFFYKKSASKQKHYEWKEKFVEGKLE